MSGPRIALLNAAYEGEETRRNFRREVDGELVEYDVTGGELPETFEFDACVVTGSRASVYWDRQWIDELRAWVRSAVRGGMPSLGVCFGHQLLADALGGAVESMGEYEIGYREVERVGDCSLFDGVGDAFTVFTTHSDRVVRLPPGARRIAENEYGVHGFRKGRAWGVQFHPEYDRATAERVTEGKDELSEERRRRVLDGIDRENYAAAREAKTVFDNFLAEVRAPRGAEGPTAVGTADD